MLMNVLTKYLVIPKPLPRFNICLWQNLFLDCSFSVCGNQIEQLLFRVDQCFWLYRQFIQRDTSKL